MKNKIILDVGFGDCGKGLATHNLCDENSVVVRFSGGQQAGHTVIHGGVKHVFSSYGSGSLKGLPSFFTEDTTFSLANIINEKIVLNSKGIFPNLFLHPLSMATTPYDIAYNRARECSLGHGSCGLGIGATMNRTLKTGHKLFAVDFLFPKILEAKLAEIKKYYYKLASNEFPWNSISKSEFLDSVYQQEEMFFNCLDKEPLPFEVSNLERLLNKDSNLVFEGSQGILLDMDHGIFPNVTYANTTSKNALKYCDPKETEIFYTSRCYLTRHGAGWMPESNPTEIINNEEEINVYNKYQQDFRIGEIDYDLINYSIVVDEIYSKEIKKNLIIGCLDQRPDFIFNKEKIVGIQKFWGNDSPKSGALKVL